MSLTSVLDWVCGNAATRRIVDTAFTAFAHRRMAELDVLHVGKVQEHRLIRLLRRAQHTRFGKDHDFARIRTIQDYQRLVPLREYEAFWNEYWRPAFPHLAGVTWPDPIPFFALSSGTTSGTTKYVPVSNEMLSSNAKAGSTLLSAFVDFDPEAHLFWGKLFFLGGSTDLRRLGPLARDSRPRSRFRSLRRQQTEVLAGDLSGIAALEVPGFLRPYQFPPLDLALLGDWEKKVRLLAERSAGLPITMVAGVPSWLLILFDHLRRVTGKDCVADVWPDLRLVIHGGVKFDPYREPLRQAIGSDDAHFLESYPCSEGFVAFEDPRYDLLRLIPDHDVFFEFVPVEELGSERPARHVAAMVETGVQYAVVLTTCAGLWSYVLGDTVAFERRNPPLLRFTGRTKYFLSAFGEHLISEEIEQAVAAAASATNALVLDFHVGPLFPSSASAVGRHLFLMDFGAPPRDVAQFAATLDRELRRLNEDYDAHRQRGVGMGPPMVQLTRTGAFAAWMRSQGKYGGQHKVPRMDNTGQITQRLAAWFKQEGLLA